MSWVPSYSVFFLLQYINATTNFVGFLSYEWGSVGVVSTRKHARGWESAAPVSDAVAHASVPYLSFFFFFSIRADLALIRAKPG